MSTERAHALLAPSGAHRWLNCTAAPLLEDTLPDSSSFYAAEGSLAHELCELLLRQAYENLSGAAMKTELAQLRSHELWNIEMLEHGATYLEHCLGITADMQDPFIAIEQRFDVSEWIPESFGHCDFAAFDDKVIHIVDFKYGQGVPVDAYDNPQLKIYALGAYALFGPLTDAEIVRATIVQPRRDSIQTYETTVDELLAWAESIKPIAQAAFSGIDSEFVPGDHCQFCRAETTCRARAEANLKLAKFEFRDAELLSDDEIGEILTQADALKKWVETIADWALTQARDHDKHFEGWKLVEGRSVRKITDQDAAIKLLQKAGFPKTKTTETKLLGITALEKIVGKKEFPEILGDVIEKPAGKPVLVPEDDKRPAISSTQQAIADFKED